LQRAEEQQHQADEVDEVERIEEAMRPRDGGLERTVDRHEDEGEGRQAVFERSRSHTDSPAID
jgi:hypothetical protein